MNRNKGEKYLTEVTVYPMTYGEYYDMHGYYKRQPEDWDEKGYRICYGGFTADEWVNESAFARRFKKIEEIK